MKTIILIFCVACCLTLQAQPPVPPTNAAPAVDPAAIERAREAVRATIAGNTNRGNPVSIFPGAAGAPVIVNTPGASNAPVIVNTPPSGGAPVIINAQGASNITVNAPRTRTNRPPPTFPAFPAPNPRTARNGATNATTPPDAVPLTPPPGFVPMAPVVAPEPEPADVDINFPGIALPEVLDFYALLVKRTILQATLPQITVNLKTQAPLTRTEAIQALDSVLAMNNITMIPVGTKFVKAVQSGEAGKQAAPFNTNDDSKLPETDQYVTRIVQLKYVKTADVMAAIQPLSQIAGSVIPLDANSMIIMRDYSANVKRMMEVINKIDVIVPLDFEQEVIPILYGKAEDIASALSSLGAGGGGGTTVGTRPTTGARPLTPGMNGSGYGGNGMGTTPGISSPGGIGGAGAPRNTTFAQRVGNLVTKAAGAGDFQVFGQTKIIADTRTNSLLVFASKQDMDMIKQIIKKLDIVLPQVLIEAIIMEVTLDKGVTTGVSYLQNNVSTPGNYYSGIGAIQNGSYLNPGSFVNTGTNLASLPSGLSYFANFGGDFQATLTAVASDSRINVLSEPRIQTSHGVPASLQVGQTLPEVTGTYFGGINGQASSQYQQTFVGIDLEVTPLINPDGLVVMDIMQDVEQLGNPTTIDGNPVPTTSKRTAQATVSVRNRDTIILGGMISNSKTTTRSGVPLLKDIPGLGYLFRSTADTSERVELIVLIHPTVLPTPEVAALEANHERDKLPGIKAAEAENRRDEIRRMKEAEKIHVPRDNE